MRTNKRRLYESIMKDISKTVKKRLNESNYQTYEIEKYYEFEDGPKDFPILFEIEADVQNQSFEWEHAYFTVDIINFFPINNEIDDYPNMTEEQIDEVMSKFDDDDFKDDVLQKYLDY